MLEDEFQNVVETQEEVADGARFYFNEEEATDYKIRESRRLRDRWETLLNTDPRLHHSIQEIDSILTENEHNLPAHISSPDYEEVSLGQKTIPDNLRLRISQTPKNLSSIDNYFFRQMTDTGVEYQVEGAPISFEIGPLYDEFIGLDTGTDYLQIGAPTLQDFYNKEFMKGIDHYQSNNEGESTDLGDIFNSYENEP